MTILLDTDVLLDVALGRAPHAEDSGRLLDHLQRHPGMGYVAWHSIANLYYLTAGNRSDTEPRHFIAALTSFVDVAPATTEGVRIALNLPLRDFEDAMQVAAALACEAAVIATRNLADFDRSPIRARTPSDLLTTFAS